MNTLKKIRILIAFYMVALVLAGVTAFPAETELKILCEWISGLSKTAADDYAIIGWLFGVRDGLIETNAEYPYIAYGYDWLAYAHIVIAMLFIGPFIDPIRNKWVVYWGMIACVTILPLAFICGPIREIPFIWTLIDCSFGVFGIMPLMLCIKYINRLEHERENNMF